MQSRRLEEDSERDFDRGSPKVKYLLIFLYCCGAFKFVIQDGWRFMAVNTLAFPNMITVSIPIFSPAEKPQQFFPANIHTCTGLISSVPQ